MFCFVSGVAMSKTGKRENGANLRETRQTRRNDGKHGETTANREKRLRLRMRTRKDKWGEKGGDKEKQGKGEETRQNRDNVAIYLFVPH